MASQRSHRGTRRARVRWITFVALLAAATPAAAQPGELLERTLAIVNGQVVTLSDVEAVRALGLIERGTGPDALGADVSRLVDRHLVLREVQRYTPPEPSEAEIVARIAAIRAAFPLPDALARVLDRYGFSETRLRAWVRDDLRIAAYLGQRFAAVVVPGDDEVAARYAKERQQGATQGLTYEAAAPAIRERLAAERRADLIADWIADLRRRTPVVELWKNR
jgi:hypothetical protein